MAVFILMIFTIRRYWHSIHDWRLLKSGNNTLFDGSCLIRSSFNILQDKGNKSFYTLNSVFDSKRNQFASLPVILSWIISFDTNTYLRGLGFYYIVVVTVWTILVSLVKVLHIFTKDLSALFAGKNHLYGLSDLMIWHFCVTFCTVKPPFTARCTNRNLKIAKLWNGLLINRYYK